MTVCLYHGVDFDGQCSAAIVKRYRPDCTFIPMNYGYDVPWNKLKGEVIMVDFSLQPFDQMIKLAETAELTWIDHHITAIEDYYDYVSTRSHGSPNAFKAVHLDTQLAACELAWRYFARCPMPLGVWLLGRYDVWDHADPRVLAFQYGLQTYKETPWDAVFESSDTFIKDTCDRGKLILDYKAGLDADTIKRAAYEVHWEGEDWLVCNTTLKGSRVFGDRTAGVISYYYTHGHWVVSLYNSPNCAAIAKEYGGGGHPSAAGFICEEVPWL